MKTQNRQPRGGSLDTKRHLLILVVLYPCAQRLRDELRDRGRDQRLPVSDAALLRGKGRARRCGSFNAAGIRRQDAGGIRSGERSDPRAGPILRERIAKSGKLRNHPLLLLPGTRDRRKTNPKDRNIHDIHRLGGQTAHAGRAGRRLESVQRDEGTIFGRALPRDRERLAKKPEIDKRGAIESRSIDLFIAASSGNEAAQTRQTSALTPRLLEVYRAVTNRTARSAFCFSPRCLLSLCSLCPLCELCF